MHIRMATRSSEKALPISNNNRNDETSRRTSLRNVITPERNNQIQGDNLKRDKQRLVEKEVPADHEAKSIINPVARKTDKATGDRHVRVHLSDGVVGETEDHGV